MFRLKDFSHLPALDALVAEMIAAAPALTVAAGYDPRVLPTAGPGLLPGGRSSLLGLLLHEFLAARPAARPILVAADDASFRTLRRQGRMRFSGVDADHPYDGQIADAVARRPDLLVLDRLDPTTVPAAAAALEAGIPLLAPLDTLAWGAGAARELRDLGLPLVPAWVVAVHRVPALCPHCKRPAPPTPELWARLHGAYPELPEVVGESLDGRGAAGEPAAYHTAPGCPHCRGTGRAGDAAVFDLFQVDPAQPDPWGAPSRLSYAAYLLHLAAQGIVALDDLAGLCADRLRRAGRQLTAAERALADAEGTVQRQSAEIAAGRRVLEQRTAALVSLQDVSQALLNVTELPILAQRICRHAQHLCGADLAVLYFIRSDETAAVLAATGWEAEVVPAQVDAALVRQAAAGRQLTAHNRWPPGIAPHLRAARLRAGLSVPLLAQERLTGLLVVHTTRYNEFTPGEVALLQTFANQAAAAIENAHLLSSLQDSLREIGEIKSYMEDILSSVDSGILTTDLAGVVTTCNRAAGRIWGLGEGALQGRPIAALFESGQSAELAALIAQALEREVRLHDYELTCTLSRRGQVTLKLQLTPLKDAHERTIGMTVVVEDLTEERRLLQTLNRYLAPSVAAEALRMAQTGTFPLGGAHREMSILFADIRGFTTYSERVPPQELVGILNRYLTVAARAIRDEGGTLDKFMGDAVMALFNAPVPQPDHALRAARAALAMQRGIASLEEETAAALRFGVGLHVGEAVAGNIGSPERLDYTAVGDAVNLARRLEEHAAGGQVLLSAAACRAIGPLAEVRPLGPLAVRGREQPVEVYELVGLR